MSIGFGRLLRPLHKRDPVKAYDRDGYVSFGSVIGGQLLEDTKRHIDWLHQKHKNLRPEMLFEPNMVVDDAFWYRLVSDDALLNIAQKFIGSDIALFATGYICKPPGDGQPVLWHQDGGYWPLEPMNVVTLWLAVDESTPENGCMRVIPRSQTKSLAEIVPRTDVPNVLSSGIDPDLVDVSKAVDVVLKPGDVSVHHPNIIHGSNPNYSEKRRCGLVIRYIPTSTRILVPDGTNWPTAYLLRGKAVPGVNVYSQPPQYDERRHIAFKLY